MMPDSPEDLFRAEKARSRNERGSTHAQLLAEAKAAFDKLMAEGQAARKSGRPRKNPLPPRIIAAVPAVESAPEAKKAAPAKAAPKAGAPKKPASTGVAAKRAKSAGGHSTVRHGAAGKSASHKPAAKKASHSKKGAAGKSGVKKSAGHGKRR